MPLQFQPVTIPLGASQDEGQAPFTLPIPLLAQLQNARVTKTGAVEKRPGWLAKAPLTTFERARSVDQDLFTIQQRTAGTGPPVRLGSVNASLGRVDYHPGAFDSYSLSEIEVLERETLARDGTAGDGAGVTSAVPDFAVSSSTGIAVVAWQVVAPKTPLVVGVQSVIFAMAIDINTRQIVDGPRQISTQLSPNTSPRVILNDATNIVVVYQRLTGTPEIRGVAFDCTARTWGADTLIFNNLNFTTPKFDAKEIVGGVGYYIIFRNSAPIVQINKMALLTSVAVTTLGEDASDPSAPPVGSLTIYPDGATNNLWCAWYDAVNGLRACVRLVNSPATIVLATTTMEAVTDFARQMTWATGPTNSTMILVWTTNGAATLASIGYARKTTKYRTLTTAGVKGVQIQVADVELVSKAYSAPNGFTYAAVLYDGSDINTATAPALRSVSNQVAFTMCICDTAAAANSTALASFRCAGTWAQGEAGRCRLASTLSAFRPVVVDGGELEYWWLLSPEYDQVLVSPIFAGRPGVDLCRQRITNVPEIYTARIGGNVVFSGGVPQVWDGAYLNEYGFLAPPENGNITNGAAGTALTAGAYGVLYVFEYRLATGDIVQSAPSIARPNVTSTSITVVAGDAIAGIVPTLNLTRKWAANTTADGVIVRAYRTEANGTKYYSEGDQTSTSGFAASYPFGATLSVRVDQADSIAVTHPTVYNDGGLLANFAPPALAFVWTHRNRLFGIAAENRKQVVFTHDYQIGELPGWHPDLVIDVPDEAVALATIDEKLVILCRHGVYLISGDGPDRKGLNSDYQQPFKLNSPHGCKSAPSVVSFPSGVMFLSDAGFCLMDRKTDVTRIGGPVEDTVTAFPFCYASLVNPEDERIYWSMVDARRVENITAGRTVVYDWRHNVWSVDLVQFFASATYHTSFARTRDGIFSTVAADPTLYLEGGNADPGSQWIATQIKTGMLHLGSNQLFQRARWLTLLGERRGTHHLTVTVDTFSHPTSVAQSQSFEWSNAELVAIGDYAPKMHLKNQKGAFFQVTLADSPDGTADASASFVGIMLEMGLKKTRPQTAQIGTK